MATTTDLRPLRDYDEHSTINMFGVSGEVVTKGTFVVAQGSGLNLLDPMVLSNNSWDPTIYSSRFNVPNNTVPAPSGTISDKIIGMTLKTQQTYDENGFPLKFEPGKAAVLDVIVSGQAVPIVSEGDFLYSGFTTGDAAIIACGTGLGVSDDGLGALKAVANLTVSGAPNPLIVATALGPVNTQGYAYIRLKL